MSLEPAADVLRRLGAVPAQDVVRHLIDVCDALAKAGPNATVTLGSLLISESPEVRAQVTFNPHPDPLPKGEGAKAVASIGYELLKGMPPPATPSASDWLGERPELVAILSPALAGNGDVATLAHQLRTLARPQTANISPTAQVPDTVHSNRLPAGVTEERAGEILGAYELVKRLGSGGMGDVYLGRHVRLGREVAVKILKPEFASQADIVQRFFQEAKVVNEINHPHIVEIHDFVEEPGRGVYCVMELLQGHSLTDVLEKQGTLTVKRAALLFSQVCDALDAAHRRGVVHRDVKPDNIFVTPAADGADFVRVLDFGIARRLTPGHSRTEVGAVLGTPYYMAPEQAAGRPVDGRADVYSVGIALLEALCGDARQAIGRLPLQRTKSGEEVPDAMGVLLKRCLSLDPAQRPASAAEVRDALLAIAGAQPKPRPSTDAIEAAAGLGKTKHSRTAVIGVGFMLTIAVLGYVASRTDESDPKPVATKEVVTPPPAATPPVEPPVKPPMTEFVVATKEPIKKKQPITKKPPLPVSPAVNPFAGRADTVRRRYDSLVARFGQSQLTSLEKAAVAQALDDYRADRQSDLAESLNSAEAALDAADRRLSR